MNIFNLKSKNVKTAKRFVKEELVQYPWFKDLMEDKSLKMLILTGSVVQGGADHLSDIDLFVVVSFKDQIRHKLNPEYKYAYNGLNIEVSMVSFEKLILDAETKRHLYWWKDSVIIMCPDRRNLKLLKKASSLNKKETDDRLWTLMCMFEMNIVDLEQIVGRVDRFSFNLNLYDCLRLFSEFMLLSIGISKRFKWYGKLIDQHFPNLGLRIGAIIVENDQKKSLDLLKELRVYHREVLSERGFSQRELNDWSNCNLDRFLFQRF